MKIWITEYALTRGIICSESHEQDGKYAFVKPRTWGPHKMYAGNEWHATEEEAQAHAQKMLSREVEKLERKLKALRQRQGIPFSVMEI